MNLIHKLLLQIEWAQIRDGRDNWQVTVDSEDLSTLIKQLIDAKHALRQVADWKLPETGQMWHNGDGTPSDRPMSYEACYGSNGARDYIRSVARNTLDGCK